MRMQELGDSKSDRKKVSDESIRFMFFHGATVLDGYQVRI
ncbi:MAG: hypothetical protein K0S45_2929 [Nitrospira sp.]|jgi:hypothetical protein|nr:hypothetical protein [Nitrospira sp.]